MDKMAKLISRKQFGWQCFFQARKSFHSVTAASTLYKRPASRFCVWGSSLDTLSSSSICWGTRPLIANNRVMLYSTEAPIEKQDSSSEEKLDKETTSENEEVESTSDESSDSEMPSPSKSQTGELLPSEQDQADADKKLDKLYKAIELEVLAYEPSVLDSYQWFVITAATHLGIKIGKCWSPLKSDKLRFPLLKSAFVHKKHQVQYEVRTYHRFLTFHKLTSSTADTFLEYIERNLPEGVGLKVTRVEAKALPDYLQKEVLQQ